MSSQAINNSRGESPLGVLAKPPPPPESPFRAQEATDTIIVEVETSSSGIADTTASSGRRVSTRKTSASSAASSSAASSSGKATSAPQAPKSSASSSSSSSTKAASANKSTPASRAAKAAALSKAAITEPTVPRKTSRKGVGASMKVIQEAGEDELATSNTMSMTTAAISPVGNFTNNNINPRKRKASSTTATEPSTEKEPETKKRRVEENKEKNTNPKSEPKKFQGRQPRKGNMIAPPVAPLNEGKFAKDERQAEEPKSVVKAGQIPLKGSAPNSIDKQAAPISAPKPAAGRASKRKLEDVEEDSGEPSQKKARVRATSAPVMSASIIPPANARNASSIAASPKPEKAIESKPSAPGRRPPSATPEGVRRSNRVKKPSPKAREAIVATDGNVDSQTSTSSPAEGTGMITSEVTGKVAGKVAKKATGKATEKATGKAIGVGSGAGTGTEIGNADANGSYIEPPAVDFSYERKNEEKLQRRRNRLHNAKLKRELSPPSRRMRVADWSDWKAKAAALQCEAEAKTPGQIAEFEKEMEIEGQIAPILDFNERHVQMGFPSMLMKGGSVGRMTLIPTDPQAFKEALEGEEEQVDLTAAWVYRDHQQEQLSDVRTPLPEPEDLKEWRDVELFGHYGQKAPFRHFFSRDAKPEQFFPEMGVAAELA